MSSAAPSDCAVAKIAHEIAELVALGRALDEGRIGKRHANVSHEGGGQFHSPLSRPLALIPSATRVRIASEREGLGSGRAAIQASTAFWPSVLSRSEITGVCPVGLGPRFLCMTGIDDIETV